MCTAPFLFDHEGGLGPAPRPNNKNPVILGQTIPVVSLQWYNRNQTAIRWDYSIMISISRLPRYKIHRLIAVAVAIFFFACPLVANADTSARCASNDSFWINNYGDSGGSAANAYSAHARQCHLEHNYRTAIVEWEKAIDAPAVGEPAPFELHIWLGTDNYLSGNSESAKHQWRVGLDSSEVGTWLPSRCSR